MTDETPRKWIGTLSDHAIWPLLAVTAASVITERFLLFGVVTAATLIVIRWVATGAPAVRTRADWPILILALMACLSLLITARPDLTVPQVERLLLGMALYYGLACWARTPGRITLISLGFALAGLLLACIAPFSMESVGKKFTFLPASLYTHFAVLTSDTINPNVMAGYLALLLPCVLAPPLFAWEELRRWQRVTYSFVTVMMILMLVVTQSRAGIFAVGVGLLVLAMLRWRWAWVITVSVVTATLIAKRSLTSLMSEVVSTDGLPLRMEVWSRGWYMLQDFAFTGIGMGSFPYVTERFYPLVLQATLPHSHNLFLQVAVDLGVPGLIAWLSVLFLIIASAWTAYRCSITTNNRLLAGITAGLLAAQSVMIVHGMFDAVTWGMVRPAVLIWGLWGTAVAALRVANT
jgi:putative inorganic carbon (hco3(-)) transporter